MLISPAYAQAAGGTGGFDLMAILPLVLIFVVFYFLLIRPQQKQEKTRRAMLGAVKVGDDVVTSGGIHGTISSLSDTTVTLRVDAKLKLTLDRANIARLGHEPAATGKGSSGTAPRR